MLPLDLVHEIKVRLVEVVDTDVTVLTTGGVGGTGGVSVDGVQGTEVATDTADLVLEDLVVETSFEFTLARGGRGDIHGSLTTSQDHVVLLGGDGGAVQGRVGNVGFEDGEVTAGDELGRPVSMHAPRRTPRSQTYFGRFVFRGGDEVGAVGGELDVVDLVVELVGLDVLQLLTGLDYHTQS